MEKRKPGAGRDWAEAKQHPVPGETAILLQRPGLCRWADSEIGCNSTANLLRHSRNLPSIAGGCGGHVCVGSAVTWMEIISPSDPPPSSTQVLPAQAPSEFAKGGTRRESDRSAIQPPSAPRHIIITVAPPSARPWPAGGAPDIPPLAYDAQQTMLGPLSCPK